MNEIIEKAFAKINLNLGIVSKREDGYHLISSVMQTVDLFDEIQISPCTDGIDIICADPDVPQDETNTAHKAAILLAEKYSISGGFRINIKKNIPVCAGLGGPSSDAAAVIRGINKLSGLNLSVKEMCEIAVKVGADVPFLIKGGKALCEGIGEILTPLETEEMIILLAKPPVKISSKWAYEEFDKCKKEAAGEAEYYNDFERVVINQYPIIGELKSAMKKEGAKVSLMSGSGSAVFGIFDNKEIRDGCLENLEGKYPDVRFIRTQAI